MLNFTVGPVQSSEDILAIGAEQVPYFRTPEFSGIMRENEQLMMEFVHAGDNARALFLTGSGTASMEAVIMNALSGKDKAIVINGGSFGQRFVRLCEIHQIPFSEVQLHTGQSLTEEMLKPYTNKGYTAFVVNMHETSTGVLYDMEMISRFCKENHLFLIVDAISAFLADPIDMKEMGIGVVITGSQKALACPPGISIIVLSEEAVDRVWNNTVQSMYFDLKDALKNGERGQTPFTPAVGILRQINQRFRDIHDNGGAEGEIARISILAQDFRSKIKDMPLEYVSESMSNAMTALHPTNTSAEVLFNILKDEYNIWICPNGGELSEYMFRVGHIGALTTEDNDTLIRAFRDLQKRGIFI